MPPRHPCTPHNNATPPIGGPIDPLRNIQAPHIPPPPWTPKDPTAPPQIKEPEAEVAAIPCIVQTRLYSLPPKPL